MKETACLNVIINDALQIQRKCPAKHEHKSGKILIYSLLKPFAVYIEKSNKKSHSFPVLQCKLYSSKGKLKSYSGNKSVVALHKRAATIFILASLINENCIHYYYYYYYYTSHSNESIHLSVKRFVYVSPKAL